MGTGEIVLLVYALLMIAGGLMGARAGSRPSLIAGVGSGMFLLVAWWVARTNPRAGLGAGAAIAAVLAVVFAMRLAKTRKAMPSGALLALSVLAALLLAWSASRG